ncbi:MAG: DUF6602 domain-containing protein [Bacteroidales bacterium]|jgi:hypothetical protein
MKKNTLIKDYSTALVKGFYAKVCSIDRLEHKLTKGELRELFVNDLLVNFITSQFSIGTGVVVDSYGNASRQTDIIIYDNRILPPIIKNSNLGTYPLESVLAIIEVKSVLNKEALLKTEDNFKYFDDNLVFLDKFKKDKEGLSVKKGIIGLNKKPIKEINSKNTDWLVANIKHTDIICHVQNYSWIFYSIKKIWVHCSKNELTFEETKRFIAWILDISRSKSNRRYNEMTKQYIPWLSKYIRNEE